MFLRMLDRMVLSVANGIYVWFCFLGLRNVADAYRYLRFGLTQWFYFYNGIPQLVMILFTSMISAILTYILLSYVKEKLAVFWMIFLMNTLLVPTAVFAVASSKSMMTYVSAILAIIIGVITILLFSLLTKPRNIKKYLSISFVKWILWILVALALGYGIYRNGLPMIFSAFSSSSVTLFRGTGNYTGIMAYIFNIATASAIPILYVIYFSRGKIIVCIALAFSMLLLSQYDANRSIMLLSYVFIILAFVGNEVNKLNLRSITKVLVFALLLLVMIMPNLLVLSDRTMREVSSLLYWRMIVIPAQVTSMWISYFEDGEAAFRGISDIGPLKMLSDLPYIPHVFRELYVWIGSANTGYLAEGYSRASLFGVCILSFLVSALLIFFDRQTLMCTSTITNRIILSSGVIYLTNLEFFTVLLTKGVLFVIFILAFVRIQGVERRVLYTDNSLALFGSE